MLRRRKRHFGKKADQLDWLKSMTNTTGVLHILTGTYELLPLRDLNGQAVRRGLEIHFPRYQFQHEPDQRAFPRDAQRDMTCNNQGYNVFSLRRKNKAPFLVIKKKHPAASLPFFNS